FICPISPQGSLLQILLIAIFGAIGTVTRYALQLLVDPRANNSFPYATLFINLTGCSFLGLVGQLMLGRSNVPQEWRLAITVGFFGGYTTFSTFGWETAKLLEKGEWLRTMSYVTVIVVAGLLLTFVG